MSSIGWKIEWNASGTRADVASSSSKKWNLDWGCPKGDNLKLISKLKSRRSIYNELGLLIDGIMFLLNSFSFISWSHVKREGNTVAHSFAHLQPIEIGKRLWIEDDPE